MMWDFFDDDLYFPTFELETFINHGINHPLTIQFYVSQMRDQFGVILEIPITTLKKYRYM